MDLVGEAGLDVAPWSLRSDGATVRDPAANPNYCYEWAFEEHNTIVLSLWFAQMKVEDGRVVQRRNMRKLRQRIDAATHLRQGTRLAMGKRAIRADVAVQHAFRRQTPVGIIVCDGERLDLDDPTSMDPSRVEYRLLDSSRWHVVRYDDFGPSAGDAVIVRDEPLA